MFLYNITYKVSEREREIDRYIYIYILCTVHNGHTPFIKSFPLRPSRQEVEEPLGILCARTAGPVWGKRCRKTLERHQRKNKKLVILWWYPGIPILFGGKQCSQNTTVPAAALSLHPNHNILVDLTFYFDG